MKLKSKCFVVILIMCILFSMAMVSANDTDLNQNLEKDSANPDDLTGVLEEKSYDDFYDI